MPATQRELRQRKSSVQTIKKVTRAMELIAASRIVKAQARAQSAAPYSRELTKAVSAVATYASDVDHPLTRESETSSRAAMLLITSDRGLAGAYSSSVIKEGEQLTRRLHDNELEVRPYLTGRKAAAFYKFRDREVAQSWDGFSDSPTYAHAREIADALIADFLTPTEEGGVDEIHIVYTRFVS
ncbi:MAG: F0F1 ATP synthase subunit gamma, partial [Propionibacteriales bacterium]|nr:F0F1 ATP synthase subunit gamma [Propionibacteriales bacterium]